MKKKALILFKDQRRWNIFLINKIKKFYETDYIFLNDINKGYTNTINELNSIIQKKKIEIVFFDVDYQKFINLFFINNINKVKKIMCTFDDYERHELNSVTAAACDMVLCSCPISSLKYLEKGYSSYFCPLESDQSILKDLKLPKTIDVLSYGKLGADRKEYIEFIKSSGIKINIVDENSNSSYEDLVKLICQSKIVVNFSKSRESVKSLRDNSVFKFNYQWKGRIIESGLCGTACVSEYAPQNDLLFNDNELFQFKNKEECLTILKKLLNDEIQLSEYSKRFSSKVQNSFEDEQFFKKIFNEINKLSFSVKNLMDVPYWYLRIASKQIILRNINIFNIKESSKNLLEIIKLTKNSSLQIKVIIFIESLMNLIWYGLKRKIKV